jgi:sulfur carrier protein
VVEVTINGEKRLFEPDLTIADLLAKLQMDSRAIAVEINQQIQPRNTHHQTRIESGDVLEIVTLVGGG